ncbi:MAG: hypothetical protein IPO78_07030 [Saprospiraceae bacterium]|nr:hypothetical protein [Saprospiraceae bacterium]MBK8484318.1 hypothetical protein [Saprospiraceae bacterium]MBK9221703.1 hypothetical protein [Saprospiraceae bacterium]MBK9721360.1 hypothetical protein [Saprospiraceae bacterium]MBK9728371.1 hypothetical protein [Saprospiraceae bacterium]
MKMCKFALFLVCVLVSFSISAQSVLPKLKDNQTAKVAIEKEIDNLNGLFKANQSHELELKIGLYQMAVDFLNEPTIIPPTTDYALTSAFLNTEVINNNILDSEAHVRFQRKQWNQNFIDLVNLVKL